jgi:DNA replication protein DnaC
MTYEQQQQRHAHRRRAARGTETVGQSVQRVMDAARAHAEEHGEEDHDAPTLHETEAVRREEARLSRMFPAMYQRMDFESFRPQTPGQEAAGQKCRAFADRINAGEMPAGLLLSGPPGRAKTHLGVSILRDVASVKTRTSRRVRVQICEVAEFLGEMRESYGSGGNAGASILGAMKGAERETPWATEMLYLLVNHRAKHELTTIITTNIDPAAFNQRADGVFPMAYGSDPVYCWRIYSRLRGMVVGSGALLDGPDGRKGVS